MTKQNQLCLFLAPLLLAAASYVNAQVPIKGMGAETCRAATQNSGVSRDGLVWVVGYLSGLSNLHAADETYRGRFRQLTVADIQEHINQFCRGKPAALLADGADDLYKTINPSR